jgi:FkbM family methyltransferase
VFKYLKSRILYKQSTVSLWPPEIEVPFGSILFLDLGANVGEKTLQFFQHVKARKIHAYLFEPNPQIYSVLKGNFINRNNVKLFNRAAWISDETLEFLVGTKPGATNSKLKLIRERFGFDEKKYVSSLWVKCIDISKFLKQVCDEIRPDFVVVKMDVEGAEYTILDRMIEDKTIELIDILLIEFHAQGEVLNEIVYRDKIYKQSDRIRIFKEEGTTYSRIRGETR